MSPPRRRLPGRRRLAPLAVATVALFAASLPATAASPAWTSPKRVFQSTGQPAHDTVISGSGHVHIATEKGSGGIHYVTNASGSWQSCQVSDGDDRFPSITAEGDVVHIAFARRDAGQKGLYTASSDKLTAAAGCGFALTKRYTGGAGSSAIGMRGSTLHIAFRTAKDKLKYFRGDPDAADWTTKETIDGKCCTSAPALAFTTTGGPRVAYGDGTRRAQGLKFAVRTSKGWKKSKASGGRVKHVAMVLDYSPQPFGKPPSNAPHLVYVVKKQGSYLSVKGKPNAKGGWNTRHLGRSFGQGGITTWSNDTIIILSSPGISQVRFRGGILFGETVSSNRKDGKPRYVGGQLTFSRKGSGVFHTQPG